MKGTCRKDYQSEIRIWCSSKYVGFTYSLYIRRGYGDGKGEQSNNKTSKYK